LLKQMKRKKQLKIRPHFNFQNFLEKRLAIVFGLPYFKK